MSTIQLLTQGPESRDRADYDVLPHVLLVVDGFPKALGGGERIVLRLAELLPAYGFRASILTFSLHPESSFRPAHAPCPVYLLPLTNTYGWNALRGALALRSFFRDQKIQIVQTFFESSDLWAGLVTRLASSAKLIWSRRDMGILRGRKHQWAYRAFRRLPHAVMAVSGRVAEHVISIDRVPASRVHVVHNGLDILPESVCTKRDDAAPVVTTIGNIRHVKGHDILLEAAATVLAAHSGARFSIAGEILEPEYFAGLQREAERLQITDRFRFLGKVSDLQKHLESASIFVLPSRSEGFSNALIEAMAAGLPCIATDAGGNAEAIRNGQNGLIIPAGDAPALAEAVLMLLADPGLARRLSIAGRHTVEREFSANAMMLKVIHCYRALLAK